MSSPARIWRPGEPCRITFDGRQVPGKIGSVASGNGWSLGLEFEALLGGYLGQMAVLWDPDGDCFRDLILWEPVQLEPLPERTT